MPTSVVGEVTGILPSPVTPCSQTVVVCPGHEVSSRGATLRGTQPHSLLLPPARTVHAVTGVRRRNFNQERPLLQVQWRRRRWKGRGRRRENGLVHAKNSACGAGGSPNNKSKPANILYGMPKLRPVSENAGGGARMFCPFPVYCHASGRGLFASRVQSVPRRWNGGESKQTCRVVGQNLRSFLR